VIKSKRTRGACHVVRVVEGKNKYKILVGNLKEGGHLGNIGVDGRIILEWILKKWFGRCGLDIYCSG
jgi:hypothetical protein